MQTHQALKSQPNSAAAMAQAPLSLGFARISLVTNPGQRYCLASLLLIGEEHKPQYLVLTGLDCAETPTGDKPVSFNLEKAGWDDHSFALVFTHTDKGYYNNTYGYLSELRFAGLTEAHRNAYLSLYGYGVAGHPVPLLHAKLVQAANQPYPNMTPFMIAKPRGLSLIFQYPGNYLGTLDIVTHSSHKNTAVFIGSMDGSGWALNKHATATMVANGQWHADTDGARIPVGDNGKASMSAMPGAAH